MLQTVWDSLQQVIRIALYALAGALVSRGYLDGSLVDGLVGGLMGVLTGLWTFYWNRKAVTVAGLEAAGKASAAAIVAGAVKSAKHAGK